MSQSSLFSQAIEIGGITGCGIGLTGNGAGVVRIVSSARGGCPVVDEPEIGLIGESG